MRCTRCEFENIPGVKTCIRCGSVMEAEAPIAIDPPRAPPWKKRVRRLVRPLAAHGNGMIPQRVPITLESRLFGHDIAGITWRDVGRTVRHVLQSLVPGLPWFLRREYRVFRWAAGVWLGVFLLMAFWYGTGAGQLFRGLTVAVHAMLIGYANGLGRLRRRSTRLAVSLMLVFLVWVPYRLIPAAFPTARMNMDIPAQGLLTGDTVVGWQGVTRVPVTVTRGMLVLGRLPILQLYGDEWRITRVHTSPILPVQIVGLPGETVRLADGQYYIDGAPLPVDAFPVPPYLRNIEEVEIHVPDGSYLVSSDFRHNLPQRVRLEDAIANAIVVPASSLEAQAVIRWYPIPRRGFLPASP